MVTEQTTQKTPMVKSDVIRILTVINDHLILEKYVDFQYPQRIIKRCTNRSISVIETISGSIWHYND